MQMMKRLSMATIASTLVLGACAQNSDSTVPPAAAVPAAAAGPDVMADLRKDVADAQKKFVDLAKAMPEASLTWTPMAGVRSVREVYLHIAGENYMISGFLGTPIPATTGIVQTDYKTVDVYEKRDIKKDQLVKELEESFKQLNTAMAADSPATLGNMVDYFGSKTQRQNAWIGTVTHLHEHLGQAIAYARVNKVVPPWSK